MRATINRALLFRIGDVISLAAFALMIGLSEGAN
jgi:hypothetical protein